MDSSHSHNIEDLSIHLFRTYFFIFLLGVFYSSPRPIPLELTRITLFSGAPREHILNNSVYRDVEVEDAHPVTCKQHPYRLSRVIIGMCFSKIVVRVGHIVHDAKGSTLCVKTPTASLAWHI